MSNLFGEPDITMADLIAEVTRELKARDHVYPRLIAKGSLGPATATKQRKLMNMVRSLLIELQAEGRQPKEPSDG